MIMKMEMSSICVPVSSVESIHRYRSATNFKTHEHKWKAHKQQMVLLNFVLLSVNVYVCVWKKQQRKSRYSFTNYT